MNDMSERDRIIKEGSEYMDESYCGGIVRFYGIDAKTLKRLVDLKYADPTDKQNDAPTLGEFLAASEEDPLILYSGYAVSGDRDDCRVTIDACQIRENVVKAKYPEWLRSRDEENYVGDPQMIDKENARVELWWD